MKTFLRAMGSELDKPGVRDVLHRFDQVHTGTYGIHCLEAFRPDLLRGAYPEVVLWLDPFAVPAYEISIYDVVPSPEAMGMERMPLVWGYGFGAHAYDWTHPDWPGKFIEGVEAFRARYPRVKILLDDWHAAHPWWTGMKAEHYRRTITTEDVLDEVAKATGADYFNGPCEPGSRFWERFGVSLDKNLTIFREAREGDLIYCAGGTTFANNIAKAVAALRGAHVGIGFRDGESLTDGGGNFRAWLPGGTR